jgi:DNA-directed RNA polymerase subunit RPC12/RpoP
MFVQEYPCPNCGEWLDIDLHKSDGGLHCTECQEFLIVSEDGEFVNGAWRDRTKLIQVNQKNGKEVN